MNKSYAGTDYDFLVKCLVVGESGVGKTAMMNRYTDDTFNEYYSSTIGVDFKIKTTTIADKKIKFQIWDTAGQERFRTITSSYYRGAHCIILCFDTTERETFDALDSWFVMIERFASDKCKIILCGTKIDRRERQVEEKEAKNYAIQKGVDYIETSSKSNVNIETMFNLIGKTIVENCLIDSGKIDYKPFVNIGGNCGTTESNGSNGSNGTNGFIETKPKNFCGCS
jgi:small GTP-binding protein